MKRKEDPRFIQGKGNYVDDVKLPGMLYLDMVRSPYAHAKILKIDASKALALPGVLAVITGEDLKKAGNLHWMPTLMSDTQMVLPTEKVVYYAQEICAVIATERYIAADAIEEGMRGGLHYKSIYQFAKSKVEAFAATLPRKAKVISSPQRMIVQAPVAAMQREA